MRKWTLCAVVVMAVGTGARAQPVSHWKFDEVGGAVARDSVGASDGAVAAPAAFVAGGVSGNAIDFPGGGYVNMGDVLPFTGGVDFSISFWARTAPGYAAVGVPVSRHTATIVAGYLLAVNAGAGYGLPSRAYFYVSQSPSQEAISTTPVNDGAWHHVVGVFKADQHTRIYVDGTPVEDFGVASAVGAVAAPFIVGGLNFIGGGPANAFSGQVDDVQVYDRVLCDPEIQFLFENPGETYAGCAADFTGEGSLNVFDFLAFQTAFGEEDLRADLDCNLTLNVFDFLAFQTAFGDGC